MRGKRQTISTIWGLLLALGICFALAGSAGATVGLSKTAQTSLTRTYEWTIDKSEWQNITAITLQPGETHTVTYDIVVSAVSRDSNWRVTGDILYYNQAGPDKWVTAVTDVMTPGNIAAEVKCEYELPRNMSTGWTLPCVYGADLPNGDSRLNQATITYEVDGAIVQESATAEVDFSKATVTEVDKCIDVHDSYGGDLGTVCYGEAPKTFTYSRQIGPYPECGTYYVKNTASFVTQDTGAKGSDDWTIVVEVPCAEGPGVGTPGYWKNHPEAWPVNSIGIGGVSYSKEAAIAFMGKPNKGDVTYIMFRALVAAQLNVLMGNEDSCIAATIAAADAWMATYGPVGSRVKAGGKNSPWRTGEPLYMQLDAYNNGLLCAPHRD
ncbi:MAG: hypothetical protein H5T69_15850 [Chloroflexi bacterium]|nr:hypothetical protein [Chloroflexota bacterium]